VCESSSHSLKHTFVCEHIRCCAFSSSNPLLPNATLAQGFIARTIPATSGCLDRARKSVLKRSDQWCCCLSAMLSGRAVYVLGPLQLRITSRAPSHQRRNEKLDLDPMKPSHKSVVKGTASSFSRAARATFNHGPQPLRDLAFRSQACMRRTLVAAHLMVWAALLCGGDISCILPA
jgi:hypothetical protein